MPPHLAAPRNAAPENLRQVTETGVDTISSGALTHSAKVLDVSINCALTTKHGL